MAITDDPSQLTHADLAELLNNDISVKVGGTDIDGMIRGKLMSKKKFLSIAQSGFGFCSVIFGWDMHDRTYFKELKISNAENGYRDILAEVDLSSFRRIPWEDNVPFFLCSFREPEGQSLSACPRSLLERQCDKLSAKGMGALAGAEYEFFTFRAPQAHSHSAGHDDRNSSATAQFLRERPVNDLPSLEEGMFGYSLTRPTHNQDWYYKIFEICARFRCDIEGWHTESGPGVYEAALEYGEIKAMADKAALFKLAVKNVSSKYGITPCFMAKPRQGLPGNSGHVHVSLTDPKTGKNLLARETPDPNPQYEDIKHLSDIGRHFLAGILEGLADVMPIVAPTVNSYKRLVENFWAPVTVSWGLEHRAASIRLIAPPTSPPKGTRFEVRVAGADTNPYLVFAAILALGYRGIEKKLALPIAPLGRGQDVGSAGDKGERLAKSLKEATERFARKGSLAREVLGDAFVEHFAGTREHEVRLWDEAVTDWEVKRYMETVYAAFKNVRADIVWSFIILTGNMADLEAIKNFIPGLEHRRRDKSSTIQQAQEDGRRTPPVPSGEAYQEPDLQSQEGRSPPRTPNSQTRPESLAETAREAKRYRRLTQLDNELRRQMFDAGKREMFYTLTRTKDRNSPKTAVLNLAMMQRLSLHRLQRDLANLAGFEYERGEALEFPGPKIQPLLNSYCEGLRNLDFMKDAALKDNDEDPFVLKSSRAIERKIMKIAGLIPDHVLPAGPLPMALDEEDPQLVGGTGRHYANRIAAKEKRLLRFAMAGSGGLLVIVPMLIMANVDGKIASLVTTCVAIAVFAALITMYTELGPNDVLGTTAAYAAVLVVFVGTSLERR
ncbi:hypothetical protein B0A50_04457 [Salinomyces thailandicus]|uniref:Glutamine synthetase n=1 Tax=Salinomyces thailandicus TaxID=706561 RepID=A0A4U0U0M6_9PEZI|nr:hypothetical protein B0A50_04457 [Salinomyces thailandica]